MGILTNWKPKTPALRAIEREEAPPAAPLKLDLRQRLLAAAVKNRTEGKTLYLNELRRITSLPRILPMEPEELVEVSRQLVLARPFAEGFRLFAPQAEAILAYRKYGGLFAGVGVGWGKCVGGDTEVFDARLGRVRVEDAANRDAMDLKVHAINDEGKTVAAQASAMRSGVKACYTLTLMSGQEVVLSFDHPVLTQRGWVKTEELAESDLVATPRNVPEGSGVDISDEALRLVAYLLADGSLTTASARFTNETQEVIDDFFACVKHVGGSIVEQASKSKAREFRINQLSDFRRKWDLYGKSTIKRVPPCFWNLTTRQAGIFLRAFWACDGYVGENVLDVSLANQGLIEDLRFLLLRCGIVGRGHWKQTTHVYKGVRKFGSAWTLRISDRASILRFLEVVGKPLGKAERFDAMLARFAGKKTNPNRDIVPISRKEFAEICDELGYPRRGAVVAGQGRLRTNLRAKLAVTQGQYLSRDAFAAWVKESGYSGRFAPLATSDLFWNAIRSLTPCGDHPVFDLSVPETGNFVANGIVVHNTLISLAVSSYAIKKGLKRVLLLIPSNVYPQFWDRDRAWARKKIPLDNLDFISLHKGSAERRLALASSGRAAVYVLPYSRLSTKDTDEVLAALKPELVIADEAHNLKNRTSARTKRWVAMVEKHKPEVVVMSGTITSKSILDYWHLIRVCLKARCPLPIASQVVHEWAQILDAGANPESESSPIQPVVEWARQKFPAEELTADTDGFRKAYKLRLTSSPGVVMSGDNEVGVSLVIANKPVENYKTCQGWPELERLLKQVDKPLMLTPNGDEIDHAIHCFKWKLELCAGFYNRLYWPDEETIARRRGVSREAAIDILERAKDHHEASQDYTRALRKWLDADSAPGLDTPFLVGGSMASHGAQFVGKALFAVWEKMRAKDFEGRPDRDSEVVRVCDFKVGASVEWAKELGGEEGVIWVHHQAMGVWIFERLQQAGIAALHCPAGETANSEILDAAFCKGKIVVASITAHGTGKNLQHFGNQLVVQTPRSAVVFEQLLGRTHRNGQKRDELVVHTLNTLDFDHTVLAAAINDSAYIEATTSNRQKLLFSAWDPIPKTFDSARLKALGAQPKMLDNAAKQLVREKFNPA